MAKSVESRQLLYANTSAYASVETSIAGIGVVIKAARRHTLFKQSDTRPTSDHVVAAYEAISLALREAKGMGLEELARRTKLARHQLESIEGTRRERLPPEAYLRGFVRTIARELGLDADEVARSYMEAPREPLDG